MKLMGKFVLAAAIGAFALSLGGGAMALEGAAGALAASGHVAADSAVLLVQGGPGGPGGPGPRGGPGGPGGPGGGAALGLILEGIGAIAGAAEEEEYRKSCQRHCLRQKHTEPYCRRNWERFCN